MKMQKIMAIIILHNNTSKSLSEIFIKLIVFVFVLFMTLPSYANEPPSVEAIENYIKQYGKEKILKEMSETLNKDLPMQLDKNTWLLSTIPISGRLSYVAKIVGYPTDILLKEKDELRKILVPEAINRVCTSDKTRNTVLAGITFECEFFTEDGYSIYSFQVSKKDCLKIGTVPNGDLGKIKSLTNMVREVSGAAIKCQGEIQYYHKPGKDCKFLGKTIKDSAEARDYLMTKDNFAKWETENNQKIIDDVVEFNTMTKFALAEMKKAKKMMKELIKNKPLQAEPAAL
jgi:hypothetical protein